MFEVTDNSVIGIYAKAAEPSKTSKALNIVVWVLQFFAAAAFLRAGGSKLRVSTFENLGFVDVLRYCAGSVEVIGAILIVIPKTAQLGAALLALTMVGAVAMHLLIIGGSPVPALVLLVITIAVTWYRGWHD